MYHNVIFTFIVQHKAQDMRYWVKLSRADGLVRVQIERTRQGKGTREMALQLGTHSVISHVGQLTASSNFQLQVEPKLLSSTGIYTEVHTLPQHTQK